MARGSMVRGIRGRGEVSTPRMLVRRRGRGDVCILHAGPSVAGLPLLLSRAPKPAPTFPLAPFPERNVPPVLAGRKGPHGVPRPRSSVSLLVNLGEGGLAAFARPLPAMHRPYQPRDEEEEWFSGNRALTTCSELENLAMLSVFG